MTTRNGASGDAGGSAVASSARQPEVAWYPNGSKKSTRRSACTLIEAVRLCVPDAMKGARDGYVNGLLAHPAWEVAGHQALRAVELFYGRGLERIRLEGCTVEQALLFCRFVVEFDPIADNHWLDDVMPEPTVLAVLTQYGWR